MLENMNLVASTKVDFRGKIMLQIMININRLLANNIYIRASLPELHNHKHIGIYRALNGLTGSFLCLIELLQL